MVGDTPRHEIPQFRNTGGLGFGSRDAIDIGFCEPLIQELPARSMTAMSRRSQSFAFGRSNQNQKNSASKLFTYEALT